MPFNPRDAVKKFAALLREYGLSRVTGDAYAGQTFGADFEAERIAYSVIGSPKSALYDALEPRLNAGEVELPDVPELQEQLLTRVLRGVRIDHQPGDHDDFANAAAGALWLAAQREAEGLIVVPGIVSGREGLTSAYFDETGRVASIFGVPGEHMRAEDWDYPRGGNW